MARVLKNAQSFIGQIKEGDSGAQDAPSTYHIGVKDMPDADQHEDDHFPADPAESNAAVERFIIDCTHDACDIIEHYEYQQRVQKAVASAKKIPKPSSKSRKDQLNKVPEFFHVVPPLHEKRHPGGCLWLLYLRELERQ